MNKLSSRIKAFFPLDSLKIQLLSRSLVILAVLLVFLGILQYLSLKDAFYKNKALTFHSQIMSLAPEAIFQTDPNANKINERPRIFIPGASLAFIDLRGDFSVLSDDQKIKPPRLNREEYAKILNFQANQNERTVKKFPLYHIVSYEGVEQLVVLQPFFYGSDHKLLGIVQISSPTAPIKELLFGQVTVFFILSLLALMLGLIGFMPVLRKTLVPLSNMIDTAEQIDAGKLDTRFPVQQGQIEIDRLAISFNSMLERLQASFEAERKTKEEMRRFIADASHELRTPLTSIHGFLEVLLRGAMNQPEQLDKALKSMHSESKRLNKLVQDLLLLSKLDRMPQIELKIGELDTVLQDMEPQLKILAGNRSVDLEIDQNIKCQFNTDSIKQVILNLFQNAVQHTDPDSGKIFLALKKVDNGIEFIVRDNGTGISSAHIDHVFDRFYRSDSSRTRKYGGAGLGLSITKSIIDVHGGTIRVESPESQGCTFTVWFPAE